jgi:hypothetical protein
MDPWPARLDHPATAMLDALLATSSAANGSDEDALDFDV